MARAEIELVGSLSHTHLARKFKKNHPQIITNPSEIQYYKAQSSFKVTMLSTSESQEQYELKPKSKAKVKPVVEKVEKEDAEEAAEAEAAIEAEAEADDGEEEAVTEAEAEEEPTAETITPEPVAKVKAKPKPAYNRDKLKSMLKRDLVKLAEGIEVFLDGTETKAKMITAILAGKE